MTAYSGENQIQINFFWKSFFRRVENKKCSIILLNMCVCVKNNIKNKFEIFQIALDKVPWLVRQQRENVLMFLKHCGVPTSKSRVLNISTGTCMCVY